MVTIKYARSSIQCPHIPSRIQNRPHTVIVVESEAGCCIQFPPSSKAADRIAVAQIQPLRIHFHSFQQHRFRPGLLDSMQCPGLMVSFRMLYLNSLEHSMFRPESMVALVEVIVVVNMLDPFDKEPINIKRT